ncbi:MAG: MFS transporter [Myxococcaceae bacterium]|nr:MFS transporter [Myxococcaceae bacterium]
MAALVSTAPTRRQAYFGLGVLSVINLLNYLDRYILPSVMTRVQHAFQLTNAQGGLLATTFMAVYMVASPVGGYLGDRMPRRFLIAGAVAIWSLATIGSGLAASFAMLLVARAMTGVGEAGYGTVAPPLISDLFKKEHRSRMLAYFYTAMPLGAALGFTLGGEIGERHSWQMAFYVGGAPGLLLAVAALFLPEPKRGAMDEGPPTPQPAFAAGFKALITNPPFLVATAGLTLMTFSIGGLSMWMPKFLEIERGFASSEAGHFLGVTTVIGGLVGTLVGGRLGDLLERRKVGGSVMMSGAGLLLAAPMMVGAALATSRPMLWACLLGAQFFIFLNNGPLNATIVNHVPTSMRAFAFGVNVFTIHALGDAASPTVIGLISDKSSLATAILLNAVPVALGGFVLLAGLRFFTHTAAPTPAKT